MASSHLGSVIHGASGNYGALGVEGQAHDLSLVPCISKLPLLSVDRER